MKSRYDYKENLAAVQGRLRELGRPDVRVVAVTKTHGPEAVTELLSAGHRDFGENRVGEAKAKFALVGPSSVSPVYHYLGPLQSGQARQVAELFDYVHGAASVSAIEALVEACEKRRESGREPLRYLIQVRLTPEETKLGGMSEETLRSMSVFPGSPRCLFAGFMTMGPATGNAQDALPAFRRLRTLRDEILPGGELSMGMSGDWELAVQEGSTMVRIGTAIFGPRLEGPWKP